jgi:hypothetical protein
MKIIDCEQGSVEWYRARIGIPTASEFHQIVTPAKGLLSKYSTKYAYRLIAERLLNRPMESVEGQTWMERGKELEPKAAAQYEFVHEVELQRVGFCTTDDGMLGASPDRIVKGRAAGVEIKCPSPAVHIGYLLDGPGDDYRPQVQGQLMVCEFDYVDFYAYSDRMPPRAIRNGRDEGYIKLLRDALEEFNIKLLVMLQRAKELGVFQAYEAAVTPLDVERADEMKREFVAPFLMP